MHVVMVSEFETQGGAAVAASRLAFALCESGHRVTRVVTTPDRRDHPWHTVVFAPQRGLPESAFRVMLPDQCRDVWDQNSAERLMGRLMVNLQPDIINIHNLHWATSAGWSPKIVERCAQYAPTVWTLHDMWSFTGRCAYSYDCRRFLSGCGPSCPTPMEYPALQPNRIAGAWRARRNVLSACPELAAVTPSYWLAREASAGLWAAHQIFTIPYGLPTEVYRPVDPVLARAALDVPADRPVMMVAAQSLSERRKGGGFLAQALSQVAHRPLTLLTLGHNQISIDAPNIRVHPLGYIDHERTKVLAYNAADLFVHPAPVDNLPNVVMEALACGTPVVGFPVGGVPDMVRPGQTGWLASEVSSNALAVAIRNALEELDHGVDLRASARAVAESEYDDRLQAERYTALFATLVDQRLDATGGKVSGRSLLPR